MTQSYNVAGSPEIHLDVLKAICGKTYGKSMLDLCCGFAPQTRQLGFTDKVYVDLVNRDLGSENKYFLNVGILSNKYFRKEPYDVSLILDGIEHFDKEYADYIPFLMEKISLKQIIFTPLGDYLIEKTPTENTDFPDTHRSGWLPKEFEDMGYATIVFPNFHQTLGIGGFFAFKSPDLFKEFQYITNSLNQKQWAK